MALDNLTLKTITTKLEEEMIGAYFDKPFALGFSQFALPYHSGKNTINKGRGTLVISLDGTNPFICYSFDKFLKINVNTPFFNALKKLAGTQIDEVKKIEGERIVFFHTTQTNQAFDTINTGYQLIVELFPQKANSYLVPEPYNKVTALYKEHGDVFSLRYINRGLPYLLPPTRESISANIEDITKASQFLSRSTAKLFNKYASEGAFKTKLNDLLNSKDIYYINNNLEPFHFNLKEAKKIQVENIYNLFVTNQKQNAKQFNQSELINDINKSIALAKKKKQHIEEDLQAAKTKLVYKEYGQELFLHQLEIPAGQTFCDFDNYHIVLNTKLSPIDNANHFFKLYHKAKSAIEILSPLIEKTQDEITYLQAKLLELDKGNAQDILELKQELALEGYIKNKGNKIKTSKKSTSKIQPHYLVSDTYKIGFGLNSFQNEELTFNIGRKDSIFLHVFNNPGSHVLILEGDSNQVRLLAAELALFLSNLEEGDVMVAYRHDVKKNKEKKGLVNILNYKLITIKSIRESSKNLFEKTLKLENN